MTCGLAPLYVASEICEGTLAQYLLFIVGSSWSGAGTTLCKIGDSLLSVVNAVELQVRSEMIVARYTRSQSIGARH